MFCFAIDAYSPNATNSGPEFQTSYMARNMGANRDGRGADGGSIMSLYITSAVNTTGAVSIADRSLAPIKFKVAANQVTIVTILPGAYLPSAGTAGKAIHITSVKTAAIYAHIYANGVSDATLFLPVSTLGKDYLSINYIDHGMQKPSTFIMTN